jgi:VWFA-related protein
MGAMVGGHNGSMNRRFPYFVMAAVVVAPLLAAAQAGDQSADTAQPPLTFRAEANFVEVDAVVTDATGNAVPDLRAADFQVLEDGKPQMVSAFSHVNIPITRNDRPLFSPTAIEPDVETNVGLDGRIYLFVLDDLHIDVTRTPRVKASLHRFFERSFGANDLAAIVFTSGRASDGQDFTNNTRLLLAAVDKFAGRKLRSSTLERIDEFNRQQTGGLRQGGSPIADPEAMERGRDGRSMMESVQKLSEFMANLHGRRKALLLVSEGVDYDIYNVFDTNGVASDIIDATRNAVATATRGNVSIYAIDPRGLVTPGADLIESSGVVTDDPLASGLGAQSALDELRLSQDSLRTLADQTGGFAVVNQNNVDDAFDRIVRDNSSYYVLGYYPANDKRDGRFRKIDVRVTRPGLTVRARRGYVAARGRATAPAKAGNAGDDALKAAVDSPLPTGGIPMRLFAAPYKGGVAPNAAVALAVELGVRGLRFEQKNGTFDDTLNTVTTVVDSDGKMHVNEKATVDMTLMPATLQRAQLVGFRVMSAVNLPPGRYQLRVSVADAEGIAGSVVDTLEVPDFYKQPIAMSALSLTSVGGRLVPTAKVKDDPVTPLLMAPPVTGRTFSRDDQITLFTEIYENQQNVPPHTVDITTEVRADGGRVVFNNAEQRSSTELKGRGGYGYVVQVPLNDFTPGVYVVHVEGKSLGRSVSKDVQIQVR